MKKKKNSRHFSENGESPALERQNMRKQNTTSQIKIIFFKKNWAEVSFSVRIKMSRNRIFFLFSKRVIIILRNICPFVS